MIECKFFVPAVVKSNNASLSLSTLSLKKVGHVQDVTFADI